MVNVDLVHQILLRQEVLHLQHSFGWQFVLEQAQTLIDTALSVLHFSLSALWIK